MNQRLSEERIRRTCRELIARHGTVSGCGLREELRRRFGAVGKTERVFRIWREELRAGAPDQAVLIRELQEQVFRLSQELEAARELERNGR